MVNNSWKRKMYIKRTNFLNFFPPKQKNDRKVEN